MCHYHHNMVANILLQILFKNCSIYIYMLVLMNAVKYMIVFQKLQKLKNHSWWQVKFIWYKWLKHKQKKIVAEDHTFWIKKSCHIMKKTWYCHFHYFVLLHFASIILSSCLDFLALWYWWYLYHIYINYQVRIVHMSQVECYSYIIHKCTTNMLGYKYLTHYDECIASIYKSKFELLYCCVNMMIWIGFSYVVIGSIDSSSKTKEMCLCLISTSYVFLDHPNSTDGIQNFVCIEMLV